MLRTKAGEASLLMCDWNWDFQGQGARWRAVDEYGGGVDMLWRRRRWGRRRWRLRNSMVGLVSSW